MSARPKALTDNEFLGLMGESPGVFSARVRAELMARDLKDRVSAVADDLRCWVMAGEVKDPASVARIARDFEHLAWKMEVEVVHNSPAARAQRERPFLHAPSPLDYEYEAWHAANENGHAGDESED